MKIYGVLRAAGGLQLLAPPSLHRPHLDHTEQQADADGEEHSNEQEAGEQVGCKAGQRLRQSLDGFAELGFGNCSCGTASVNSEVWEQTRLVWDRRLSLLTQVRAVTGRGRQTGGQDSVK